MADTDAHTQIDPPPAAEPADAHGWQLAGDSADAYERLLVPAIFEPWAQALVARADPRPGERVLDVACGTGAVARAAAAKVRPGGAVVGVDVNPTMLAAARRAAPTPTEAAAPGGVTFAWEEADAADLPFPDGAFDVVVCQQGLQFFADRAAGVREMRRVLEPGGRLALAVWRSLDHNPAFARFADALDRHAEAAGPMMRGPFAFGDQGELRALLRGAGFAHVRIAIEVRVARFPSAAEFLRYEALASPIGGPLGALDEPGRAALVADVEDALAPFRDDDGLALPLASHVALAR